MFSAVTDPIARKMTAEDYVAMVRAIETAGDSRQLADLAGSIALAYGGDATAIALLDAITEKLARLRRQE